MKFFPAPQELRNSETQKQRVSQCFRQESWQLSFFVFFPLSGFPWIRDNLFAVFDIHSYSEGDKKSQRNQEKTQKGAKGDVEEGELDTQEKNKLLSTKKVSKFKRKVNEKIVNPSKQGNERKHKN